MVLAVVCTTMILFVEGFLVSLLWPGLPLAITVTLARVLDLEARVVSFKMNKLRFNFNFFGAECFELWKKSLDRLKRPYERECYTPYHLLRGNEASFFYLDIVAENGRRSHTEVTVCMHGQHTQESMDGPGMVAIPAHGRITRGNDVFPVPVRACEIGFAERIWPSRPASARSSFSTLRLNIVLTRGIPAAFHEGVHIYTANRYWVSPKFIGSLPRVRWHIISKRVFS